MMIKNYDDFKDKVYEYWTKTTKDGNYYKKLRVKNTDFYYDENIEIE